MIKKETYNFEVLFANHSHEFSEFYKNHGTIFFQILGVRKVSNQIHDLVNEFYISDNNFIYAIRRLYAFFINYSHYIGDNVKITYLEDKIEELENRFLDDEEYHRLCKSDISGNKAKLKTLYLTYVFDCFNIINEITKNLQGSMMLSVGALRKTNYVNDDVFFVTLRDNQMLTYNAISNMKFNDLIHTTLTAFAFYSNYKLFMKDKSKYNIDKTFSMTFELIFHPEVIRLLQKDKYNQEERSEILIFTNHIKRILGITFRNTKMALSELRILPKPKKKILIDKTGI